MARGPHRHLEERIWDIVHAAREMNFKLIIGHPAVGSRGIERIEPPLRPGEKAQLEFYIGKSAWEDFKAGYFTTDGGTLLRGVTIEYYKPLEEEDGAQKGRTGAVP